jgi:hypothetical protein
MSRQLKLSQLPDRVPVKIAVTVSPELKKALDDYAAIYASTYGQKETVTELIPYMLDVFLSGDTGFREARKSLTGKTSPSKIRKPRTPTGEG